ncbi:MAG: YqeG family HAD IIIA-type phosphatase [Eubacteriales bacterium]|jgi:HAD superfamily phosphatase (TIGR01668 family)|nr:YqeG family HAD IIIA-type phosphatase [Eubacteriales bacterium]
MLRYFIPDAFYDSIYDIDIAEIKRSGIRGLICDIDNTLVPYEQAEPTGQVSNWIKSVRDAGIEISFVSNNGANRVDLFNRSMGFFASSSSGKPSRRQLRAAMTAMKTEPGNTAIVGDQIFTDIVAGKRLGLHCILVKPIKENMTVFFMLKRLLEKPFILIYNIKKNRKKEQR